ncbi:MAG: winged helix-turn-helix domain-containing protein, partial [Spirochaetes bacterium]|nr:winged helix-turn-helix domain-containing protein [Spirochaetota bacterium]
FLNMDLYPYNEDNWGEIPFLFMKKQANRYPLQIDNLKLAIGKKSDDKAAVLEWDAFLAFIKYYWDMYLAHLIEQHKSAINQIINNANRQIQNNALDFFLSISERIRYNKKKDTINIDKWTEYDFDASQMKIIRICPSLFSFPHLVVMKNSDNTLFEISTDIPFQNQDHWNYQINAIASLAFALSDKSRLRILIMIANQGLTQKEIGQLMGYAKSTISRHISILEEANLIQKIDDKKREGIFIINQKSIQQLSPSILSLLKR